MTEERSPAAWTALQALTPARVALGRTGVSLPTREVLRFGHAHALARDAVLAGLDGDTLADQFAQRGLAPLRVTSAAPDRARYLRRPDLGRRLAAESLTVLESAAAAAVDVAVIVADGLSATAVANNALPLIDFLWPAMVGHGWRLARPVIATQARVAIGDAVGAALRARLALVLIGERPGLSAPDSLGAYLTYGPRVGRRDNERNCVSNIRAAGLTPRRAADALLWLMAEALRRGETGVALKDESRTDGLLGPAATA